MSVLVSDLMLDVRSALVEPVAGFWSEAELLRWFNRAQEDFVGKTLALDGIVYATVTAGQPDYPLPSTWISARLILLNDPNSDGTPNWKRLDATNLEKMAQERPNFLSTDTSVRGTPRQYWIWDKSLYMDPVPDTTRSGALAMFFRRKPAALSTGSSIEVDDTLSGALTAYVLMKAWDKEKNAELSAKAQLDYETFVRKGLQWRKRKAADEVHKFDLKTPYIYSRSSGSSANPLSD